MSDEFEDRENELGELPLGIQIERNEFSQNDADAVPVTAVPVTPMGTPRPGGIPSDIKALDTALGDGSGVLGSPVIPASVTSTYDARPVNGQDWKATTVGLLAGDGDGAPAEQTLTISQQVPAGFTGVLRGFQFTPKMIPEIPLESLTNEFFDLTRVTILVNGIVQQDYNQLKFGAIMDRPQEVFIVAGELQIISMEVVFSASFIRSQSILPVETTPVLLQLYGNNLLTRGLPTPFEIATQIKSGTNTGGQ